MSVDEKLDEMGLKLPEAPSPLGAYVPALVVGSLAFVSGEKASVKGEMVYRGKVGGDLTIEDGYQAARICGINCLAALGSVLESLDGVEQVVKVVGYVNSAPGFTEQPKVVNGASELFLEVFGDSGQHARVAVGVNELPDDSPVEISMIVKLGER